MAPGSAALSQPGKKSLDFAVPATEPWDLALSTVEGCLDVTSHTPNLGVSWFSSAPEVAFHITWPPPSPQGPLLLDTHLNLTLPRSFPEILISTLMSRVL